MRTSSAAQSFLLLFSLAATALLPGGFAHAQTEPPPATPAPIELQQAAPPVPDGPAVEEGEAEPPVGGEAEDSVDEADDGVLPPPWMNEVPAPSVAPRSPPRRRPVGAKVPPVLGATQHGSTGLLRTMAATTLAPGRFVLQATGVFSSGSSVVVSKDENTRLGASFAGAYGLRPGIELFGSLTGSSNRNVRQSEPERADPETIRAFGDLILGGKFGREIKPGADVAAYTSVRLMAAADGVFLDFGTTSLAFGGVGSWDLSEGWRLPARVHVNVGYLIDNSRNLQDFDGFSQPSRLVGAFAYGIGRSRFQTSAALEVLAQKLGDGFVLTPLFEYHLEVITGKSDPAFSEFTRPECPDSGRACQENRDQQWLTLGARGQWGDAWWATLAMDIGVNSPGFPFGPPQPAFGFVFQLGGRFGAAPPPPPPPPVAPSPPEPEDGVISGVVTQESDGAPLPQALVAVEGRAHARVATDPDGTFTTHDLEPGSYDLLVTAPGFEPKTVRAKVSESMVTEVEVALAARALATVRGRLVDAAGQGLAGQVRFDGTAQVVAYAQASGLFETTLPPGVYLARAEADDHLVKEQRLSLDATQVATLDFTLRPRRPVSAVEYHPGTGLAVRSPITFVSQAGGLPVVLSREALQILDEVVDVLVKQPGVRRLVVETHWDRGAAKADAMAITEQQAHAVSDYLQGQGVAADRIELAPRGASATAGKGAPRTAKRAVVLKAIESP